MRLYLSSNRFGVDPSALAGFIGKVKRIAAIFNARDYQPSGHRALRRGDEIRMLLTSGLEVSELDLREFLGKPADLRAALENYGALWISGGSVFLPRMAMKLSGLDTVLKERLKHDSISYAGYSAAGCVMSPSLEAFTEVDSPSLPEAVYGQSADLSGSGVLEYCFVPHFESDHPESALVKKSVEKLEMKFRPHRGLHDGEVLIINNSKERVML